MVTAGKTIDSREITTAQIEEIASSDNPPTYAARIRAFYSLYDRCRYIYPSDQ